MKKNVDFESVLARAPPDAKTDSVNYCNNFADNILGCRFSYLVFAQVSERNDEKDENGKEI